MSAHCHTCRGALDETLTRIGHTRHLNCQPAQVGPTPAGVWLLRTLLLAEVIETTHNTPWANPTQPNETQGVLL